MFGRMIQVLIGRGSQIQSPYSPCSSHYWQKMSNFASVMVKIWKELVPYVQISTFLGTRNSQVVPFYQCMFFLLIETILGRVTGKSLYFGSLFLFSSINVDNMQSWFILIFSSFVCYLSRGLSPLLKLTIHVHFNIII